MLSLAVWISAVVAADPNEECAQPNQLSLDLPGKNPDLLVINELPTEISVLLQAPSSVCRELASQPDLVQAVLQLSDFGSGEYTLPVEILIGTRPVRVLDVLPSHIKIVLEIQARVDFNILPILTGEPARGFQTENLELNFDQAQVTGPQSLVDQVNEVWAELDISGVQSTVNLPVLLKAVDAAGQIVSGISIDPPTVNFTQIIVQSVGYRTVAVRVETEGQPSSGYLLTAIQVLPPTVTISSSDPQQVDNLPGFVSTQPLDLTDLTNDEQFRLSLDLPPGVFVEGEQTVLVLVGITAIEGNKVVTVPVENIGLTPGLEAQISPETVDVFLSGPVAILNALTEQDVRVFVDLSEHEETGTFLLILTVEILPDQVQLDSVNPTTVEVTLIVRLTPFPTPALTPTPTKVP